MYGLVLEGGGAKGSYQIGVWRALRELNIDIGAISGTSIGAINGAFITLGLYDEVYDIWYNMEPDFGIEGDREILSKLIDFDFDVKSDDFKKIMRYLHKTAKYGGLNITPLKKILKKYIDEDKLRKAQMDYGIVTFSLSELKGKEVFKEEIPYGKLHDYIVASANLPIFKVDKIENKTYIDGGFYDNLPIGLIAKKGYKKIIAVRLQAIGIVQPVKNKDLDITYIIPSGNTGKILEFKKETMRNNLKMGYYDTLRVFKDYKGKKYCIETNKNEKYFFDLFANAPKWSIEEIKKIFGENNKPTRRLVFEKIIPIVADLLDLNDDDSYETLVISLLEFVADYYKINRYKVYLFDEFVDILLKEYKIRNKLEKDKISYSVLSNILKQSSLYRKTIKDKLLLSVFKVVCCYLKEISE
ncbi:patatin-like phospholipase family protein [Helicovermis profundi]|uniref:Patatin-like phospholipase family protein n=1 Tax=Helicovermis profundi TaxID=3065157 RepID=A0AAU9EHC7_9FIRM|nr:patatin-like phospholipase family protein [Clostridia bacterium S502]